MFYEALMEKKAASRYDAVKEITVAGPTGRYILGGALAGGLLGRKTADEDHKTRDMLLGAVGGGALGAGASRFHKALSAHKMKSKGLRARVTYDRDGTLIAQDLRKLDPSKKKIDLSGIDTAHSLHEGTLAELPSDPQLREAALRVVDIADRDFAPAETSNPLTQMLLDRLRERELLRGGRNVALGAGAGLGLTALRKRDNERN